MAKGSSGFNKGGKSGGLSEKELSKRLPDMKEFSVDRAPKLEGTEKQINWANDIRKEILRDLSTYAVTKTSDGRPSDLYKTVKQGKDAIINDIKNNPLISDTSGKLRKEKIESAISGYKDLASRIKRLNNIAQNSSAKFWIDNRTNQAENYRNKKLRDKIDGR